MASTRNPLDFRAEAVPSSIRVSLRIEKIDPRDDPSWDDWVTAHPAATVFHSCAWARVLTETYGHRPIYLQCSSAGQVAALLPLMEVRSFATGCRAVCLPFSDFCAPLIFQASVTTELNEQLYRLARSERWNYFEMRGEGIGRPDIPASASYYAHEMLLADSPDEIFAGFEPANQRAIRKAERSSLTVDVASDVEAMDDFLTLHAQTRSRHGLPPQPRAFFDAIQVHLLAKGLGFIVLVRERGKAVASALFLQKGETAIYKFGASDRRHLELRPNNLTIWRGIQELLRRGATSLHFGRTDLGQEGLRRFKLSWGARETAISYYKFDLRTNQWATGSSKSTSTVVNHFFRALPPGLNRLAGNLIYPHLD